MPNSFDYNRRMSEKVTLDRVLSEVVGLSKKMDQGFASVNDRLDVHERKLDEQSRTLADHGRVLADC